MRRAPPVVNHEREARFAARALAALFGPDRVRAQEPSMPAEDFAFMLEHRPGAYLFIGNGDGAHRRDGHGSGPCMLHNPSYDFNDALIAPGAAAWVQLARQSLAQGRGTGATRA